MILYQDEQSLLNHYRTLRIFTKKGRVIFYGSGYYCRTILALLFKFKQPFPDMIIDDNCEETDMLGIPIRKPEEAELKREDTVLIAVDSPGLSSRLKNNLIITKTVARVIEWNYNFNILSASYHVNCNSELKWHCDCFNKTTAANGGKLSVDTITKNYFPADLMKTLLKKKVFKHNNSMNFLEIGTGLFPVLTYAGIKFGTKIWALDILADKYCEFLSQNNISLPVSWLTGKAENLKYLTGKQHFDLIMMDNSLDHVIEPLLVLENCLDKLTKDGIIIIKSHCKEGSRADWTEFHKHDLTLENNELVHYDFFQTRTSLSEKIKLKCRYSGFYHVEDPFMGKILCFTIVMSR